MNTKMTWAVYSLQIFVAAGLLALFSLRAFAQTLGANQWLTPDTHVGSPSGRYQLLMQGDGNLVLYDVTTWGAMWASGTYGWPGLSAVMQGDGNLVMYDGSGRAHWSSRTYRYPGSSLYLQDDGNLVIYTSWWQAVWASNTVRSAAGPKRFQTALYAYATGADQNADVAFFSGGNQPSGLSILAINYADVSGLSSLPYDWSRIVAVFVDEPYWTSVGGGAWSNPCYDGRYSAIPSALQDLQRAAAAVKSIAPRTRFWVNFSEPEVQWMMDPNCAMTWLNDPSFDVVSMDKYNVPFDDGYDYVTIGSPSSSVKPYYDFLANCPAAPSQQLALVPGTFYFQSPTYIAPITEASWLQGFFDYANSSNQSCNLPLGGAGATGNYDGCKIWAVMGFWASSGAVDIGGGQYWVGLFDSTAWPILATWQYQVGLR
jgi:hypothetical protein